MSDVSADESERQYVTRNIKIRSHVDRLNIEDGSNLKWTMCERCYCHFFRVSVKLCMCLIQTPDRTTRKRKYFFKMVHWRFIQ